MESYDPLEPPDPQEWLALDEGERLVLILDYHESSEDSSMEDDELDADETENRMRMHAVIHTVVETQLAMDINPVVNALKRLTNEGLSRHDAIHAIGTVLAEDLFHILRGEASGGFDQEHYYKRLDELTAAAWRAMG